MSKFEIILGSLIYLKFANDTVTRYVRARHKKGLRSPWQGRVISGIIFPLLLIWDFLRKEEFVD